MSKKLEVQSLSIIALSNLSAIIVSSIGQVMMTSGAQFGVDPDLTITMVEINSYLENSGATGDIYDDLLKAILRSDTLEASIRFTCLQMLLNECVQNLATEFFPTSYYDKILHVISVQGKGLRHLNMKGVWVKEELLCIMYEIIRHLPNLVTLIIPHIANDNLLQHIGAYSKSLRHLDISGETDVTEIGLDFLCRGKPTNCLTIVDIGSLGRENVCHSDVALLIENLPNLSSLHSYSYVGKSLKLLSNKNPYFNCKLQYIHDTDTTLENIQAIVMTCPKLEELYMDNPKYGILDRMEKMNLRNLKINKFSCDELLTVLDKMGHKLTTLSLLKGKGVLEIGFVIRSCPSLLQFDCYMMDSLTYITCNKFDNIEGIEILGCPISLESLRDFLCRMPTLKRMAIDTVNFTDEDMIATFLENDFKHLEHLWFTFAPNLTLTTVEIFLENCPELLSIGQLSEWNLSEDDLSLLNGMLKSGNSAIILTAVGSYT